MRQIIEIVVSTETNCLELVNLSWQQQIIE